MSEDHISIDLPPKTPEADPNQEQIVYQYWKSPGNIFNEIQVNFFEIKSEDDDGKPETFVTAHGFIADEEGDRVAFSTTDPDSVIIQCEDAQYFALSMPILETLMEILTEAHEVIEFLENGGDPNLIPAKFFRDM